MLLQNENLGKVRQIKSAVTQLEDNNSDTGFRTGIQFIVTMDKSEQFDDLVEDIIMKPREEEIVTNDQ